MEEYFDQVTVTPPFLLAYTEFPVSQLDLIELIHSQKQIKTHIITWVPSSDVYLDDVSSQLPASLWRQSRCRSFPPTFRKGFGILCSRKLHLNIELGCLCCLNLIECKKQRSNCRFGPCIIPTGGSHGPRPRRVNGQGIYSETKYPNIINNIWGIHPLKGDVRTDSAILKCWSFWLWSKPWHNSRFLSRVSCSGEEVKHHWPQTVK